MTKLVLKACVLAGVVTCAGLACRQDPEVGTGSAGSAQQGEAGRGTFGESEAFGNTQRSGGITSGTPEGRYDPLERFVSGGTGSVGIEDREVGVGGAGAEGGSQPMDPTYLRGMYTDGAEGSEERWKAPE